LKHALCAPYSEGKSWELWSFTEVPDDTQTQVPTGPPKLNTVHHK